MIESTSWENSKEKQIITSFDDNALVSFGVANFNDIHNQIVHLIFNNISNVCGGMNLCSFHVKSSQIFQSTRVLHKTFGDGNVLVFHRNNLKTQLQYDIVVIVSCYFLI